MLAVMVAWCEAVLLVEVMVVKMVADVSGYHQRLNPVGISCYDIVYVCVCVILLLCDPV